MKASPMFNCLPGTMLSWRRMHEWSLGRSCGRALLNDTADLAASHRLFNPVQRWPRFLVTYGASSALSRRFGDYSSKWKVAHWKSVNTSVFVGTNPMGKQITSDLRDPGTIPTGEPCLLGL